MVLFVSPVSSINDQLFGTTDKVQVLECLLCPSITHYTGIIDPCPVGHAFLFVFGLKTVNVTKFILSGKPTSIKTENAAGDIT